MIIYRYLTTQKAFDLLETGHLLFTPPKYFNDINEFSPTIERKVTKKKFIKYFKNHESIKKAYNSSANEIIPYFANDIRYLELIYNDKKLFKRFIEEVNKENLKELSNIKDIMSKYFGVVSCSYNYKHPLMWAHYADSHKGLCLGFDSEFPNSNLKIDSDFLTYKEDKYLLPIYFRQLKLEERFNYYRDLSLWKHISWAYEEEYRLIASLKKCTPKKQVEMIIKNGECREEEYTAYYQEMNLKDIRKIYLGVEFDEFEKLKEILKGKNIIPEVFRMKQDINTFSLVPFLS